MSDAMSRLVANIIIAVCVILYFSISDLIEKRAAQHSAHPTKATPRWAEVLVNKISGLFSRLRR